MSDDEKEQVVRSLLRIANAARERGHASLLAFPKDDPSLGEEPGYWRRLAEREVAREWANSMSHQWGYLISDIRSNQNDPPDCFANLSGNVVGVEVTELVKSNILSKVDKQNKGKSVYPYDEQFDDETWSREEFVSEIVIRLRKKNQKAERKGIFIDVLVIVTDELDLEPQKIECWLRDCVFARGSSIHRAFLLRTYWPGYREHWPIYELRFEE